MFFVNSFKCNSSSQSACQLQLDQSGAPDLLPSLAVGYTKGWKRATMALICLQAIKQMDLHEVVDHHVKAC